MQSIMTDDWTLPRGQKNHAPEGSAEDPFRGVRHPHRGFGPAFWPLPAATGHPPITARRHL